MISVRDAMRRAMNWHRDSVAIVCGDKELTFGQAWARGCRLANAFAKAGLKPQDRIAVLEENSLEAADFMIATAIGNYVRVPLYKRNAPEAHAHMVRNTGCRALVVDERHLHEIEGIRKLAPSLEHVIVRGEDYESWLASHSDEDPDPQVGLDDYYIIRHSGGTTGLPKGMGFSHRAWMNMQRDLTYRLTRIEAGDACIHVAPISHGSGYLFVPVWISGGYNVLEPKFDAERTLHLLSRHGGYMFAVPTLISDLVVMSEKVPLAYDKLKALVISGSPILPQTAIKARSVFGDVLNQFYGQTEATPIVWMTPKDWFGKVEGSEPLLAAGRVMPFGRIEIRDDGNRALPAGEVGEIAIQVDGQISEIWNSPELSKQRIVDGWVLTGDIGRIDGNGYLYLSDRKDDLIISGGFNIWPAELEMVIGDLPQVREVVVVRAPHPRFGETPAAVVVLNDGAKLESADVIRTCEERLGKIKRPSIVEFRSEPLPRTPVGKLRRNEVRKRFWEGSDQTMRGA
jgi:acyl-CoA synthetase (AMP-forming)/AMP-acid ligase II